MDPVELGISELLRLHKTDKAAWDHLVGWYVQNSGRSPHQIIGGSLAMDSPAPGGWEKDLLMEDWLEKHPGDVITMSWLPPTQGTAQAAVTAQLMESGQKRLILELAIGQWAESHQEELAPVLNKAGWTKELWSRDEWAVMRELKMMKEGPLKVAKLAQVRALWPRWSERCMRDETCG